MVEVLDRVAGFLGLSRKSRGHAHKGERSIEDAVSAPFNIGYHVEKVSGDYRFSGQVVACFLKLDGASWRVVVENADGVLHIFSPSQLRLIV